MISHACVSTKHDLGAKTIPHKDDIQAAARVCR